MSRLRYLLALLVAVPVAVVVLLLVALAPVAVAAGASLGLCVDLLPALFWRGRALVRGFLPKP